MLELSKFCRIYCNENHRKWAELLPHIENRIKNSVCSSTGYTSRELMYGIERPNIFKEILPKESWPNQEEEENEENIRRAVPSCKTDNFEDLHLLQAPYFNSKIFGQSAYKLKEEQEVN
jgi:hypothetical protein